MYATFVRTEQSLTNNLFQLKLFDKVDVCNVYTDGRFLYPNEVIGETHIKNMPIYIEYKTSNYDVWECQSDIIIKNSVVTNLSMQSFKDAIGYLIKIYYPSRELRMHFE